MFYRHGHYDSSYNYQYLLSGVPGSCLHHRVGDNTDIPRVPAEQEVFCFQTDAVDDRSYKILRQQVHAGHHRFLQKIYDRYSKFVVAGLLNGMNDLHHDIFHITYSGRQGERRQSPATDPPECDY